MILYAHLRAFLAHQHGYFLFAAIHFFFFLPFPAMRFAIAQDWSFGCPADSNSLKLRCITFRLLPFCNGIVILLFSLYRGLHKELRVRILTLNNKRQIAHGLSTEHREI
jgi:hypothetical protein